MARFECPTCGNKVKKNLEPGEKYKCPKCNIVTDKLTQTSGSQIEIRITRRVLLIVGLFTLILAILAFVGVDIRKLNRGYYKYREVPIIMNEVMKQVEEKFEEAHPNTVIHGNRFVNIAKYDNYDLGMEVGYILPIDLPFDIKGYQPGEYRVNDSPNILIAIETVKSTIRNTLDRYLKQANVKTVVLGVADALPVSYYLYSGDLGLIRQEYLSKDSGKYELMELVPRKTLLTNESIAFLRAYDVLDNLNDIYEIGNSPSLIVTEQSPYSGAKYRRVSVNIRIEGALKSEYEKLKFYDKATVKFADTFLYKDKKSSLLDGIYGI